MGMFLRDIMKQNPNFRLFGPDETASNRPSAVFELTGRAWRFVEEEEHPISRRPLQEIRITEWMDALYDVQDTLMLSVEDDID